MNIFSGVCFVNFCICGSLCLELVDAEVQNVEDVSGPVGEVINGSAISGPVGEVINGSAISGPVGEVINGSAISGPVGEVINGSAISGPVGEVINGSAISGPVGEVINGSAINAPHWPDDYAIYLQDGDTFDHIVVGAGARGAAVAARLALDGLNTLLVEAGEDPNLLTRIPGASVESQTSPADWSYPTESNNRSCLSSFGRQCRFSRGKALGGSTTLSDMVYVRGTPQDYDSWNWTGWSWQQLRPYFLIYEHFVDIKQLPDSSRPYHNTEGIMKIGLFPDSENSWHPRVIQGMKELNFKFNYDVNAESQIGVTQVAGFTFDGEKESTATAYLTNDKVKSVLKVAKNTLCTGLIIDEQKVVRGIKVRINNLLSPKYLSIYSKYDVVLSAGTVGNPQILMLSGIGPADHLQEMGIPVVADQPVGDNMSDHVIALSFAKVDRGFTSTTSTLVSVADQTQAAIRWAKSKDGPLASIGLNDIGAFFNINCYDFEDQKLSNNDTQCSLADTQITFSYLDAGLVRLAKPITQNIIGFDDEVFEQISEANENNALIIYASLAIQPKSKGYIRLRNTNPLEYPEIYPNYLDDERDAEQLAKIIQFISQLSETDVFQANGAEMLKIRISGCPDPDWGDQEYRRCYVRHMTFSGYRAAGTTHGAVSSRLQVTGVSNLRVGDLSVAPYVPRGNTQALAIAIGERLAALLKEERNDKI